jgi:hypothetical protein
MATTYAIRPHLYYSPNADGVGYEEALKLIKNNKIALVGSRELALRVLLGLGFSPENAAFTMNYAIHGAVVGTEISVF